MDDQPLATRRYRNEALHGDLAERSAFVQAFAAVPEAFTPAERMAIAATFFEGRSMRAASDHLGVPFGTLRYRVQCARRILRAWQEREGRAA